MTDVGGFRHTDHILTRGSILAKCHSTAWENLIAAILDKLGQNKHARMIYDGFSIIAFFEKEYKTIKAKAIAD